jgi:hypothetical protein
VRKTLVHWGCSKFKSCMWPSIRLLRRLCSSSTRYLSCGWFSGPAHAIASRSSLAPFPDLGNSHGAFALAPVVRRWTSWRMRQFLMRRGTEGTIAKHGTAIGRVSL